MLKVAFIVPDNRDEHATYHLPEPAFGTAPTALLAGFSQLPDCEIHIISTTKQPLAAPAQIARNLYFHSIFTPRFGRARALYASAILKIRRLLKIIQPDIVHGQGSEKYSALAAVFSGFPNVVTLHGILTQITQAQGEPAFSYYGFLAMLERFALRRTQGVICLSHHGEKIVSRYNRNIYFIPNAVDETFFAIPRAPAEPPEIVYAAHIYEVKNQAALIKALDPLAARLKLNLLGRLIPGDPLAIEVAALAATRPWVQLPGFLPAQAVRQALARAAILAHPSLEENCPMAILEAMAAGVPVAASRAGGIPDLIDHGVTGLLFDPKNPDDIRAAVERLLTQPAFAQQLARAARAQADTHFRPHIIAQRHLEIYRQLLKR